MFDKFVYFLLWILFIVWAVRKLFKRLLLQYCGVSDVTLSWKNSDFDGKSYGVNSLKSVRTGDLSGIDNMFMMSEKHEKRRNISGYKFMNKNRSKPVIQV